MEKEKPTESTSVFETEENYFARICELKEQINAIINFPGFSYDDPNKIKQLTDLNTEIERLEKEALALCKDPAVISVRTWYAKMNNPD